MSIALKVSTVLSWILLIVFGGLVLMCVLSTLLTGMPVLLIFAFLMGAMVLHSYAALKLHRSIRGNGVPLGDHTPVGIRFIGFIVLFFGICYIGEGVGVLQHIPELVKTVKAGLPAMYQNENLNGLFRTGAIISIVVGLCLCVNVFLNFRLLRWYYLVKQSDIS